MVEFHHPVAWDHACATLLRGSSCRVPGYRLHRRSGQARVIIDGRHFYLGPFGSPESRETYQAIARERQLARGLSREGCGVTAGFG